MTDWFIEDNNGCATDNQRHTIRKQSKNMTSN